MPVNHMHYIKCTVNSSLLTLLWLLQKVCGTLDPCFITTHSIHREGVLQIHFGVIFHETMNHAQAHFTSDVFIHCPFLAARNTDSSAFVWMISLASVCYGDSIFSGPTLVLQPICGLGDLGSFQLPQSNSSPEGASNLSVYLAPHADNSIQLLSTVRSRRWKCNFMVHLLLDQQKVEYLCSFLEAVPRLVISHLLQPVVQLC